MNSPNELPSANVVDARALKALAHPLRIELLEQLLDRGPSTASALGRAIGQTSGTLSYHLRRLAEVGLITDATDLGTGRDRYWQATAGWTLNTKATDTQASLAQSALVEHELTQRRTRQILSWLEQRHAWPDEWRDASLTADTRLDLTAEDLAALGQQLLDTVLRYRATAPKPPSDNTSRIIAQIQVFPIGDPPDHATRREHD